MLNQYLTQHFLVAMPSCKEDYFERSVCLIAEHKSDGAMGIVINHPLKMTMGRIFDQLELEVEQESMTQQKVLQGGPMHTERGIVLHRDEGNWRSTKRIDDHLFMTTTPDILQAIAVQQGPEHYLFALGFAGWMPGQLEKEIADNAWLVTPFQDSILFDCPYAKRWQAAAAEIGVAWQNLSVEAGHA